MNNMIFIKFHVKLEDFQDQKIMKILILGKEQKKLQNTIFRI